MSGRSSGQSPRPVGSRAWMRRTGNQPPELNGPRVDSKKRPIEACPAPPQEADGSECTQVVLGRMPDVERFKGCKGYVFLNRSDWTIELNDEFVACSVSGRMGATCSTPILIASGWKDTDGKTEGRGIGADSITAREMCQLRMCNWDVQLHQSKPGAARFMAH